MRDVVRPSMSLVKDQVSIASSGKQQKNINIIKKT